MKAIQGSGALRRGVALLFVLGAALGGCQADNQAVAPTASVTPGATTIVAGRDIGEFLQAAQRGDAAAQAAVGMTYLVASLRNPEPQKAQDAAQALRWLRASAAQKNANGQHGLGMAYDRGVGVAKNPVEAVKHYRLAVDQNQTHAQAALGLTYATGNGVAQDYAEAVRLLRLAADKNDASAQNNLGMMYVRGQGVGVDLQQAAKLFKLSADKDNATAQGSLGWSYQNGHGVAQDNVLAYFWYSLAAPRLTGTTQANLMKARDEVAGKLTPVEMQRAQIMVREWKPGQLDAVEASLQEAVRAAKSRSE